MRISELSGSKKNFSPSLLKEEGGTENHNNLMKTRMFIIWETQDCLFTINTTTTTTTTTTTATTGT